MYYSTEKFIDELVRREWTPEKLASLLDKLDNFTSAIDGSTNEPKPIIGKSETEKALKQRIANFLLEVGIPTNIKGFNYLTSAILMEMKRDPSTSMQVTKVLYPTIAREYETTSSSVERDIRHAIELCCNSTNSKIFELAGSIMDNKRKLENYKFITFAALYLKQ